VVSVRLELLVRSPDDNASEVTPTYKIGGEDYLAPDRRLRQVLTTTIALRNRVN
jgi:type IV pilus assembly protein PilW